MFLLKSAPSPPPAPPFSPPTSPAQIHFLGGPRGGAPGPKLRQRAANPGARRGGLGAAQLQPEERRPGERRDRRGRRERSGAGSGERRGGWCFCLAVAVKAKGIPILDGWVNSPMLEPSLVVGLGCSLGVWGLDWCLGNLNPSPRRS